MSAERGDILRRILDDRCSRLAALGPQLGCTIPAERSVPVVPPPAATSRHGGPALFEIKRRSPSRGAIAAGLDAVAQAERYHLHAARAFSVLTESAYFGGSLDDLVAVKARFPGCCVLRKDFLQREDEIDVSYRAGADLVLLIAAALEEAELEALHAAASAQGIGALVELHDRADLEKVRGLKPPLVGINSRDLRTFRVDRLAPLALAAEIEWDCTLVYESGIGGYEDALVAAASGFEGVLVGEAAMRSPELVGEVLAGQSDGLAAASFKAGVSAAEGGNGGDRAGKGQNGGNSRRGAAGFGRGGCLGNPRFWAELMRRRAPAAHNCRRPLVKICGLVHADDGRLAAELGADVLGFVFADSPRRADPALLEELADLQCLKVAVVQSSAGGLAREVCRLLHAGLLDAVQFHGDEAPAQCLQRAFPYYKALRLRGTADLHAARTYGSPRVLVDAFDPHRAGGTGKRIAPELVQAAAEHGPLWLAGGLSPGNIAAIIRAYRPELVDVSSGVELTAGRKDAAKLERYMKEIRHAVTV